MRTAIELLSIFELLAVLPLAFGATWLGLFWCSVAVLLGVWELILKIKTGKTITQHYMVWAKEHRSKDIIIKIAMVAAMGVLVLHFS